MMYRRIDAMQLQMHGFEFFLRKWLWRQLAVPNPSPKYQLFTHYVIEARPAGLTE